MTGFRRETKIRELQTGQYSKREVAANIHNRDRLNVWNQLIGVKYQTMAPALNLTPLLNALTSGALGQCKLN